jgi:hypothetical protein
LHHLHLSLLVSLLSVFPYVASDACKALSNGDAPTLGKLMSEAQAEFDRYAQPACPSQLTMPILHKVVCVLPLFLFCLWVCV